MYTLFTDTDCDITPEIANHYGMKLISMPYTIDGVEIKPYVDFKEFDYKTFYDRLRKGTLPTTSALPPVAYIEYFEPEFKAGNDIVYVHFSANMSATFNSLRLAMEELQEKYPERKLTMIDTKGITIGSYSIVLDIAELYKKGATVEELVAFANENVDRTASYFFADDLKFFHKSGRVGGFSAFFGGIIGIRPIIHMDENGRMTAKDKSRGRKQTLEKLLAYVVSLQDHIEDHRVVIAHTDALDIAKEFGDMLQKAFDNKLNIEYEVVNPTAGSHCGPNAIGVSFHARHR